MEDLVLESGIKEYRINEKGVLRFNPGDPNVYARFIEAQDKLKAVEQEMMARAKAIERKGGNADGEAVLRIMRDTDRQMKEILNEIFALGNDFDQILEGVNLMAITGNGKRVITNLLEVLQPIMEEGAKACVAGEVEIAKKNKEQRKAVAEMA